MTTTAHRAPTGDRAAPGPAQDRCEPCAVDPVGGLFASRSVGVHLVRGVLGLLLAVGALALAGDHPAALLLLLPAGLAWRGCPTCWLLGLAETRRRRDATTPRPGP